MSECVCVCERERGVTDYSESSTLLTEFSKLIILTPHNIQLTKILLLTV